MEKYAKPPEAEILVALLILVAVILWLMSWLQTRSRQGTGQADDPRALGQNEGRDGGRRETCPTAVALPAAQVPEHRYHDHEHLVRISPIRYDIPVLTRGHLTFVTRTAYLLRVMIYFTRPLAVDVHITRKRWTTKLLQGTGLAQPSDIRTGYPAFDRRFLVHGQPPAAVQRLLAPPFLEAWVTFMRQRRRWGTGVRDVQLSRCCLTYTEGPYAYGEMSQLMPKAAPIVEELFTLVSILEALPICAFEAE